jgi:hypothetical protein
VTPRTQVIVVAAVFVLAGAIDFVQRIYVSRSPATRELKLEEFASRNQPLPLASARERLQSWLPTNATESQETPPGGHNEPLESGRIPDRADIGGWRFILLGVFDAGPPFAVFDIKSSASGEIEQHRVSAGEAIQGVRIERIAGHSVDLLDGDKMIHLALFIDPEDNMAPANEAGNEQTNVQTNEQ